MIIKNSATTFQQNSQPTGTPSPATVPRCRVCYLFACFIRLFIFLFAFGGVLGRKIDCRLKIKIDIFPKCGHTVFPSREKGETASGPEDLKFNDCFYVGMQSVRWVGTYWEIHEICEV